MKPRDEISTIVAGVVIADEFRLEFEGDPVATFGTDDTGPFPIFRLDFESPEWVGPDVETHIRWAGQNSNGSQLEIGTTNATDDVAATVDMNATPGLGGTSSVEIIAARQLFGSWASRIYAASAESAGPEQYSQISLNARASGTFFPDVSLSMVADSATGSSFINLAADDISFSGRFSMIPAGSIVAGIWTTPPPGFLMLDGSSIASGSTLFPDLWAVAPASWKAGTTLNLPNLSNRFLQYDTGTPGALAGSNSHTIASGNLPPHSHTIAHTHDISHTHDSGHGTNAGSQSPLGVGNSWAFPGGASNRTTGGSSTGSSGGASSGSSGNGPGTSTAIDHTPAHMTVRMAVKT